jgi:hypothetical protein
MSSHPAQTHPFRWLTTTTSSLTFRSQGVGDLEEMMDTIK